MMFWSAPSQIPAEAGQARVVVNVPSQAALLSDLEQRMRDGQGYSIATLNLDHVTKLRHQPAFLQAYLRHSHVTADGNPIRWLAQLAGQEVSLVPGSELIDPISALAAGTGVTVALFGATQESLDAAAVALEQRHRGLRIVARIAPAMGFDPQGAQADAFISDLRDCGASLCFVALGAPKQEIFAIHASAQLPHMGFVSIGAGLDFISGRQTRAPRIVRRFAGEWLWRLAGNPRRLAGRYAACIAILPHLLSESLRTRFRNKSGSAL